MKKIMLAATMLFVAIQLIIAQAGSGTKAGNDIAERVEAQETSSTDQKALVKEIAEAARKAGEANPDDAGAVKEAVRKKLDEIRDRESSKGKPGGKNNKEIEEWVKKLKRDLMDNKYVSLPKLNDTPLVCTAAGTGRTTGHIATLVLYNPTNQAVTTEVGPFFIPSDGRHQPYVVPSTTPVTVQPGSTVNVPLQGYCADIHTPPVPANGTMPPVKDWVSAGSLPADWTPSTANGWKPAAGSSALNPGTSTPLGHTIDLVKHPKEAAPVLLEALTRITTAYDGMKSGGIISTPFSGNPDKERESVIQQTLWIYAAELTGTDYKIDDFSKNTVMQYEAATGLNYKKQPAETQNQVQGGVVDFWNTFQAVGNEAKVIKKEPDYLLCYDKKGCAAGSYLGSVKTEADCKAVGGKSVRKGLFGDCKDLK